MLLKYEGFLRAAEAADAFLFEGYLSNAEEHFDDPDFAAQEAGRPIALEHSWEYLSGARWYEAEGNRFLILDPKKESSLVLAHGGLVNIFFIEVRPHPSDEADWLDLLQRKGLFPSEGPLPSNISDRT